MSDATSPGAQTSDGQMLRGFWYSPLRSEQLRGAPLCRATLLGVPLLRQVRRSTALEGTPLEWSDDRYAGEAVSFVIENSSSSRHTARVIARRSGDSGGGDGAI